MMNDKFEVLRDAILACQNDVGSLQNDTLLQYRNAANLLMISELLAAHDRMVGRLVEVAAVHSVGELSVEELGILSNYRKCDAHGKEMIAISASVASSIAATEADRPRCDVVEIGSKRQY